MTEQWGSVPGFDAYECSDIGRVRNKKTHRVLSGTLLKGYVRHGLYRNGLQIKIGAHRIVALTFIPNPYGLPCVLHSDGNSLNNTVDNLRWGSPNDNVNDMMRHGTHHNVVRDKCKRGHVFSENNMRLDSNGKRICRACNNTYQSLYYKKGIVSENVFQKLSDERYKEYMKER